MKEKIDQLFLNDAQLPRISSVVTKVMQMVQKQDVAIPDLAKEISNDPGLTADVIKLSNSAYYRAAKPIKTVQESLMTLGIKTVKDIILLTATRGILKKDLKGYQVDAEDNWIHSLTVAELSKRICEQKKTKSRLGSGVYRRAFTQYRKGDPCRFLSCSNSISQRRIKNSFRILWRIGKKTFRIFSRRSRTETIRKMEFSKRIDPRYTKL